MGSSGINALQLEKSPDTIKWLMDYFSSAREEELRGRRRVEGQGITKTNNWSFDGPLPIPNHAECAIKNAISPLSAARALLIFMHAWSMDKNSVSARMRTSI